MEKNLLLLIDEMDSSNNDLLELEVSGSSGPFEYVYVEGDEEIANELSDRHAWWADLPDDHARIVADAISLYFTEKAANEARQALLLEEANEAAMNERLRRQEKSTSRKRTMPDALLRISSATEAAEGMKRRLVEAQLDEARIAQLNQRQ